MDAGDLDRLISILADNTQYATANAFGEKVPDWSELTSVWANYKPMSDGEKLQYGQTLASMTARFTIRWSSEVAGVDPTYRIRFDGRDYDIAGVKEIARREWLEITATARAEAS